MDSNRVFALILAAIASWGCAREPAAAPAVPLPEKIMPADAIPQGPDQVFSPDGLVQVPAPELKGRIYVRPPRPNLQRYKWLLLNRPELTYRRGTQPFPPRAEEALRDYFGRRVREELAGSPGWELTDSPGPEVLSVGIAVHDLSVLTDKTETTSTITRAATSAPCLLRLELFDSKSQLPLFRFLQRRHLQAGSFGGGDVDSLRLRREFDEFAREIGKHLRTTYVAVKEIQRREEAAGE